MNKRERTLIGYLAILLILLLGGSILVLSRYATPITSSTPTNGAFSDDDPAPTDLPGNDPASISGSLIGGGCRWAWARQPNPELSAELENKLEQHLQGVISFEVEAESFGETCDISDGTPGGFGAMATDFHIEIWVNGPIDSLAQAQQTLSPIVREVLIDLVDYPPDMTPGPMPGGIDFVFTVQDSPTSYVLSTGYISAMKALEQGLSGVELLDAIDRSGLQEHIFPTPTCCA